MVEALARSVAPTPLRCPTGNCRAQYPTRDALEAAVQAGPGLRNRARRIGEGTIGDEDLRSRGGWYVWDSVVIGPPLDVVSLDDLGQHFATRKKYSLSWQSHNKRPSVHVLGILNHALREHRPNRDSATPNSLLREIKLWYLMPILLHSPDGRIKRPTRFAPVESGDTVLLLP